MRLFFAIQFDPDAIGAMVAVQERLRALGPCSRSSPENLHLTLAFLGEVAANRLPELCQILGETEVPELCLTFDRVGCFPGADESVWWLGIAENQAVLDLQQRLCGRLRDAGFSLEGRRFQPHITLARRAVFRGQPDCAALLAARFSAEAAAVSLMRSERIDGRLVYTAQCTVRPRSDGLRAQ